MIDCISVSNMRESDRLTIEKYVPGRTLMYRAAMGVFLAVEWKGNITIAVGSGNNGGDGYALAYILKRNNIESRLVALSDKRSEDGTYYATKCEALGLEILPWEPGCFDGSDMIVDCLLGTGFQGSVRQNYMQAIQEINDAGAYVVSVDINSGMNGDTGRAELAVKSDLTVTIGFVKTGLVTPEAAQWMKRLVCTDIGIILDHRDKRICGDSEWLEEYGDREDVFRCPAHLDMTILDASGYSEKQ